MKVITSVPNIKVTNDKGEFLFQINTVQDFYENESNVIVKCAEYVPKFIKGFVGNMIVEFMTTEIDTNNKSYVYNHISDLVLVYINKKAELDNLPEFEYIFYK